MIKKIVLYFLLVSLVSCEDEANKCECSLTAVNVQNQEVMLKNFSNLIPVNNMTKIDNLNKCESDCRTQASLFFQEITIETPGTNFYDINSIPNASDKICNLINIDVSQPGLNIFLKIQSLNNYPSFAKLINMGNVCCNRPCSCMLKSKYSVVKNFANELTNQKNKAYTCNEEVSLCESECRDLVANYYNYDPIKDTSKHLGNIFDNRIDLGESRCSSEASPVYKPGIEYFISIQTTSENDKNIYLGKVCCNRPCDCKIFKSDSNRTELLIDINSFLPSRDLYYSCDNEEFECLKDCRQAAGFFLKNEEIKDLSTPVSSLDLFSNFYLAAQICSLMKKEIVEPGALIFLRYSTNVNSNNQIKEDLKIGRLCCQSYFNSFLPANRCNQVGLPG